MVATRPIPPGEIVATADQRVLMRSVPWAHYEAMLALRGDKAAPRMAYLDGVLEIMSPSPTHETLKSRIGHLVEVYLLHEDVTFEAVGAWTLKYAPRAAGVEPDECYMIGDLKKDRPDLAIEVFWTSGGLDKLDIYARIGVGEVWVWKDQALQAYALEGDTYAPVEGSRLLPGIDLATLAGLLDEPSASSAIKKYRAMLETP